MSSICLYFHAHQPLRIKKYEQKNIGKDAEYFNAPKGSKQNNKDILDRIAEKCYIPTNIALLEGLERHPKFRVSFSISGVLLEQLEAWHPEVIRLFQQLVKTGRVELVSETYYHSLAFLYSEDEFHRQVELHNKKLKDLFDYTPTIFRNTELIYNNDLARVVKRMGYKGILIEGADRILRGRSQKQIYTPKGVKDIKLLLKHYQLSDDIAFRFSEHGWNQFPLTASKFARWTTYARGEGKLINLFMDYETFGEHQWRETGIFEFLKAFPVEFLKYKKNSFVTPSEALEQYDAKGELNIPDFISWADIERDLSAWCGNTMQKKALKDLYALEKQILATKSEGCITAWRRLQTSDHFYYMCTKWFADGDVHKYFNPYDAPKEAHTAFMNALTDLQLRTSTKKNTRTKTCASLKVHA